MKKQCLLSCVVGLALACPASFAGAQEAEEAGEELIQMVIELMADQDKDIRAAGLDQVRGEAKGTKATLQFAAQLFKLPDDAQVALLSALADRGDRAARPSVLAMLENPDPAVRAAALAALGSLGEAADVPVLVKALSAQDPERAAARASLARLPGEPVTAALVSALQQGKPALRVALLQVLAERRAAEALQAIEAAALDADPQVRAAAMVALGQLGGPQQIPAMVRGVLKAEKGREREAAEKQVMFVCQRSADPRKRAEPLLAALAELPEADRTAMLSTVGRVGGPAALVTVEAAIAGSDAAVHEAGVRAMCNWPDASVAPRLIELMRTDKHPAHQRMALTALIRVAPLPDGRTDADRLALLQKTFSLSTRSEDRIAVLKRASAIRTMETLRFVVALMDEPALAEAACLAAVELAHHRDLREPNKAEFDRVLDRVMATSKDAVTVERAGRYKKGQTWTKR